MAVEDFTTYTEVDGDSTLTVISTRITGTAQDCTTTSYVYDDKGASHFGDFEHLITVDIDTVPDAGGFGAWSCSTVYGDWTMIDYEPGMALYIYDDAYYVQLYNMDDLTKDYYNGIATTYYLTIERSSTTGTCKIYDDSGRTNLVDTLSLTVDNDACRYIQGHFSRNGASGNVTFYTENLDLQEAVTDYPISASVDLGLAVTASRLADYPRIASVSLGLSTSASRAIAVSRSSSATLGFVASILKAIGLSSSVDLGFSVTASRSLAAARSSLVTLGFVNTVNRVIAVARSASTTLGFSIAIQKAITLSSSVTMGFHATVSRTITVSRSAAVVLGLYTVASTLEKIKRLVLTIGTNRTSSLAGTNRTLSSVGTNRTQSTVGTNRDLSTVGDNRDLEDY